MVRPRPTPPASRPWSSACWPREAETVVWETSFSSIGRAPMRRFSARSWASVLLSRPVISAPVLPSMPSGFSRKSIVASETIRLSSVIAKRCCAASRCSGVEPGGRMISEPRCASRLVARANARWPSPVNCMLTAGPRLELGLTSGFLMSDPDSSESSSRT